MHACRSTLEDPTRGRLSLSDIKPPTSYSIAFEGQGGAAGFAKGGAQVKLARQGDGTLLTYDVKANVGGKLAQIGSRLVDAAARKVADEFFQNFNQRMRSVEDQTVVMPAHAAPQGREKPAAGTLPTVTNTTLVFFAAGTLVIFVVSLLALFG